MRGFLELKVEDAVPDLWFRVAAGERIEQMDAAYRIDDGLTVRIVSDGRPVIAEGSEHAFELRVPLGIGIGTTNLVLEYSWQ